MSERRRERGRERDEDRRATTGPFGTMLGATFGPVGAAVGSVVDETRVAFTFSFGTGVGRPDDGDDGLDDPATIEIEDAGEEEAEAAGSATENEADGENGGGESGTDDGDAA